MGIVIRQSFKGTIISYVGAFLGFLTTFFVATKFLKPEILGLTQALVGAASLICSFSLLGIATSAPKFFPYFRNIEKKHNGFFFYLVSFAFFGLVLSFTFMLLFKEPIKAYFSKESPLFVEYFPLIFPFVFFMVYQMVFETYSTVLMRIVVPRFVREVLIRLMTVTVFLLYAFDFITLDLMIYLYVAEYGIASLINLLYVSRIGPVSLSHNVNYVRKPLKRYIFRFTGYMTVTALGTEIINRIGMLMIASSEGLGSAGIYSIAFFMAAIVEIPSRSLQGISLPLISTHIKEKNHKEAEKLLQKVSLNQFLIGALIFTLLWINIDNVFAIIPKGEFYSQGKMVVFFLGLTRLCDLIGLISISTLNISKYYYYLFIVLLISVITIAGNYLLIPIFGITGSSISSLISYSIYYIIVIVIINVKLKYNPLSRGILKVLALMGLVFLLNYFFFTFDNPIVDAVVRTTLFGGMFIFLMYFWKISLDMNNLVKEIFHKLQSALNRKDN